MKVLFVNPWLNAFLGNEKQKPSAPHLGLAYLIATLKHNGVDKVDVYDEGIENNDEILFKKIGMLRPDIIGVTTFSFGYENAMNLIKKIKKYADVPVIIGGPHVSAVKGQALTTSVADFAMKGESELSFIKFLAELSSSKNFEKVGNLIWRNPFGNIVENKNEPLIENIDEIPFPDYEIFGFERYNNFTIKMFPIITSRGCPYGCNYCSAKLSMGRGFRARSPENVLEEMKYWIKTYKIKKFGINDDCFNLDIKRAEKILDLIIKEGLDIRYGLYTGIRVDRVTEQLLRKMKESGCEFISYGCESGNQDIINNMGKSLKIGDVRKAVELTNKFDIRNSVNFIIGHKGETYKTAMDSINFAKTLPTNFVNFYNLIPYPGTDLHEWVSKNASYIISSNDYLSKAGSSDLMPVFETKEFSKKDRIKALKKGFALSRKTLMQFKFGKIIGYVIYLISLNNFLFSKGIKFVFNNRVGFFIYRHLSRR